MLLLILAALIVATFIFAYKDSKYRIDHPELEKYASTGWSAAAVTFIVLIIIDIIVILIIGIEASESISLKKEIRMYEEENVKIEYQVSDIVKQYIEYEGETFNGVSDNNSSPISLAVIFPDLKSNTLVESQLEVYVDNNNNIKFLKQRLIETGLYKWWLYFGN